MSLSRMHRGVHCIFRESVIVIMHSMSIIVTLAMSGLMANSSASRAVVWLAKTLKIDICYPSLQKYTVEMVCIFLEGVVLVSVITMRVEKKHQDTDGQETLDRVCDC